MVHHSPLLIDLLAAGTVVNQACSELLKYGEGNWDSGGLQGRLMGGMQFESQLGWGKGLKTAWFLGEEVSC